MPAYFDTGFSVRQPMWHGEGYVPDRYPADWDEARTWAGLTWEPKTVPVFGYNGIEPDGSIVYEQTDTSVGTHAELPDQRRVVRDDTGATLAVVGKGYTLIDHREMGDIFNAVLEQDNVRYETAGSLEDGRKVWALAMLDEPVQLPGDNSLTLPYCALLNAHDGGGSAKLISTAVRIVCRNTYGAAESKAEQNGVVFSFRHTSGWRDRVSEARDAIRGVRTGFGLYVEHMTELLGIPVTAAQTDLFIREFIPSPPAGLVSDRVARNVDEARKAIRGILASPTVAGAGVDGTAYGLVMAATEYLDYVRRSRTWETKLNRSLLSHEPLKSQAARLAREVAAV